MVEAVMYFYLLVERKNLAKPLRPPSNSPMRNPPTSILALIWLDGVQYFGEKVSTPNMHVRFGQRSLARPFWPSGRHVGVKT